MPFTYIDYESNGKLWPGIHQMFNAVERFQVVNSYGLFRRMTGVGGRPEVVLEGSYDGQSWTVSRLAWGRPLGSSRPTGNPTLPRPPLNPVPKCHSHTVSEPLQGWGLPHCPGQPGPTPDHSLSKEISPISNLNPP